MSKTKLVDEIGQFTAVPDEFIKASHDLSDRARWLFVLLRFYTNGRTGDAFPSYDEIQTMTGWSRRHIAPVIRELLSSGWITRQKRFGASTIYRLTRPISSPVGTNDEVHSSSPVGTTISSPVGTTLVHTGATLTRLNNQTDINQTDIAADAAPPQKPANPSKKKATSRQTPIQPEAVMVPPAPPVSPEQAAADLAMFDDLESASGRELPPPTGTSKDAIERALILACVPSGERREINALMGQIRKAGLIIREGDICTADDIMARCVGKGSLFYTTHFAENDEDGLTKPPTPMTIATWIWKLEECRSRKFKPVRAPIDYDQALAEAEARAARSREQSDPSPFKPIIPAWQVLTMPRRTA